jgi:sugar transferase (PEP-CTERM/EpsH1 system associated)
MLHSLLRRARATSRDAAYFSDVDTLNEPIGGPAIERDGAPPRARNRLLFLAHRLPYPPNKGDKIRSYHLLRHLAQRHDVYLATLIDDPADLAHVAALRGIVRALQVERIDKRMKALAVARALLTGQPFSLPWFHVPRLQRAIDEWVADVRFDAIFAFSSPMAEYMYRSGRAGHLAPMTAVDLVDIDSRKWQQYAQRGAGWTRWLYARESRLLGDYERRLARDFDALFVVGEHERALFPGGPPDNLHVVQNGVDFDAFAPGQRPPLDLGPAPVVFTGVMDYWPNVDAVTWFAERIWPMVQSVVPGATFYIVGSRPTAKVRALAKRPGIVVTGHVDDVRDYLEGARACVAPLRIARGIQNKVLEAMANAKAVVATPQAFEGIGGGAGEVALVHADEQAFANACIRMLMDPTSAAKIGAAARAFIERTYAWDKKLEALDAFVVQASAPSAPLRSGERPALSVMDPLSAEDSQIVERV